MMGRFSPHLLLPIFFLAAVSSADAFILDPNSGTFAADRVTPPPPPPVAAQFRYLYVGAGGGSHGAVGTLGLDLDGGQWNTPYLLELRGSWAQNFNSTVIMWHLGVPVTDWLKLEGGVGYGGASFESHKRTGSVGGIMWSGRIALFGEKTMLRLGYYATRSDQAENGRIEPSVFMGGEAEISAKVPGRMTEGKIDLYRRIESRWISGVGVMGIARRIQLDAGVTSDGRPMMAQDRKDLELHLTVGRMW